jgi:hypothetical protein
MRKEDSGVSELDEKLNALLSDPGKMAQVMQLAQQLSGSMGAAPSSPPPTATPSLPDGLDMAAMMRFLPLLQELNHPNQQTEQLLNALRPFLKTEKQDNIPKAIRLARLIHIGKKALTEMGGLGNV